MPAMEIGAANGDVMSLLYALTSKQRDTASTQRAASAERKGAERTQAFERMREALQAAKEAKEDGGWLGTVTDILDAATDATIGGNPLQDVAHRLSEETGVKAFDIAYDFIRPDALLHGAVVLTSAATDGDAVAQTYDVAAGNSSLKTRFQGAADMSGREEAMDAYSLTRDGIAAAAITVGTCGTGVVAIVAVASSALLMAEAKLDVLGKAGVDNDAKMWIRVGAQATMAAVTLAGTMASSAKMVSGGAKVAVNIINGASQVTRGSVQVGEAMYEKASADHLTESERQQNAQHQADREQERIISGLRDVAESYQRSLETIATTMNERDQAALMLARSTA
jgi:hypothetical protein